MLSSYTPPPYPQVLQSSTHVSPPALSLPSWSEHWAGSASFTPTPGKFTSPVFWPVDLSFLTSVTTVRVVQTTTPFPQEQLQARVVLALPDYLVTYMSALSSHVSPSFLLLPRLSWQALDSGSAATIQISEIPCIKQLNGLNLRCELTQTREDSA